MRILLIVPAYNEEANIVKTVRSIEKFIEKNKNIFQHQLDYVVINDGSKDRTKEILEEEGFNAVHLVLNLGIGGAVQTGYQYALQEEYDIAIQFDGDGQHDINSLSQLIQPIVDQKVDFVIGSRFLPGEKATFQTTFMRRVGIKILSFLIYLSSRVKIYDVTSGFRACNSTIIAYFAQNYPTSYPEPESTVRLLKKNFKIGEVAVNMMERTGGESSIQAFTSIKYMFEVSLAIIISNFMREGD